MSRQDQGGVPCRDDGAKAGMTWASSESGLQTMGRAEGLEADSLFAKGNPVPHPGKGARGLSRL